MACVLEWFPRPFQKASVMVEQDLASVDLLALLWGHKGNICSMSSASPLTIAALTLWYRRGLYEGLSSDPSPLSSLFDNPAFPQGIRVPTLGSFHRSSFWPQAHTFILHTTGSLPYTYLPLLKNYSSPLKYTIPSLNV